MLREYVERQEGTNKFSKEVKYSLLCLFSTNKKQETMKIHTIFHSPPQMKKTQQHS